MIVVIGFGIKHLRAMHKGFLPCAGFVTASVLLSGCGFHLTGSGSLPAEMGKTYLESSTPNSEFLISLREELRLRGLEIVESEAESGARLIISVDETGQRVLSVSARNIPREYEIYYNVTFSLETSAGNLIDGQSIAARRNYTFDETEVLAKSREERILRQALANDLARRVVRRIEAAGNGTGMPIG
jgi:LPS-assembly lipoprotein